MAGRLTQIFIALLFSLRAVGVAEDTPVQEKILNLEERLHQLPERAYYDAPGICQGRLTAESGVAISTSDQTAKTTVYFTPYKGNVVSLYDGSAWAAYPFTEMSLALGTLTSGANYDVFLYSNSGTLTLELSSAWTNDTTRADALTTVNGVYLKSGATTRRYVGTFRTASTTTTQDTDQNRWIWSQCSQVTRRIFYAGGSGSYSYAASSWREAKAASATHRVSFVLGDSDALVELRTAVGCLSAAGSYTYYTTGVGIDSSTVNSSDLFGSYAQTVHGAHSRYRSYPGLGYHYATIIERGSGLAQNIYPPLNIVGELLGGN